MAGTKKLLKRNDENAFWSAKKGIEKHFDSIINLFSRSPGQNWETVKIQEQLHVVQNIKYFGACLNVYTGLQEHNHIADTKKQVSLSKDEGRHWTLN